MRIPYPIFLIYFLIMVADVLRSEAVPEAWGLTVGTTDTFLDSLESFVLRLVHGGEACNIMITDYADGTMACLFGLLVIHRSGVRRVGEAAGTILSLLTRMLFVYETVTTEDGALTGAVFTSWVEPPDAAVWAAHLARLSVFAAHMHDVMTPLLEIARGLLPVGAGAGPIDFEELRGDGGDRPDPHLRGVDINPADLQGGEFQARAERAVMGDFAPNPPSATGES